MKTLAWEHSPEEVKNILVTLWHEAKVLNGCRKYAVGTQLEIESYGRLSIAKGFNRSTVGTDDCKAIGSCYRIEAFGSDSNQYREKGCRALHSEQEALLNMYKRGVNKGRGTMYVTAHPCNMCSKIIASSGLVSKLIYLYPKMDELSIEILENAGIEVTMIHKAPFSIEFSDY